jgi:hypothetical protein
VDFPARPHPEHSHDGPGCRRHVCSHSPASFPAAALWPDQQHDEETGPRIKEHHFQGYARYVR